MEAQAHRGTALRTVAALLAWLACACCVSTHPALAAPGSSGSSIDGSSIDGSSMRGLLTSLHQQPQQQDLPAASASSLLQPYQLPLHQQQPLRAHQQQRRRYWRRLAAASPSGAALSTVSPEAWRVHHIFNLTLMATAQHTKLEPCPPPAPGVEWPVPGSWSAPRGGYALPFTEEAQKAIWAHQHPADCSNVKYLVYSLVPSGIGSVLHVVGSALALAMDFGRVFVERSKPAGGYFTKGLEQCGATAPSLDRCYFEPYSGCPGPTQEQWKHAHHVDRVDQIQEDTPVVIMSWSFVQGPQAKRVPKIFHEKLAASAIPPEKHYYWWRAQGTAYLVRPNARARQEIDERIKRTLRGPAPAPGCIALHVRHGDKSWEAPVYANEQYDGVVHKLKSLDPQLSNRLFLSTEDPRTVDYFGNRSATWALAYTDTPRKPQKGVSNMEYMARIGWWEEMINSLMNLHLATQCSAFAGAINSNWVRLIDELRSTVRCRADALYADAQYPNPHAMDYSW